MSFAPDVLSPRRLAAPLRAGTSTKLRRPVYRLAERQNPSRFGRLQPPETLDSLGQGIGMLTSNGKLDAKYRITAPEEMWTPPQPRIDRSDV